MRPTVVKVGGSFARSSRLRTIVAALEPGRGRTVVVPGGGPFADAVRREQPRIGCDDIAAHKMALLAMAQLGTALAGLSLVLATAQSLAAIRRALAADRVPVWLPLDIFDGHPDVPESWDMTSDSLSVWLARRLGAARLIVLKHGSPKSMVASDLASEGVVDPLLPRFLAASGVEAFLCGPRQIGGLGAALASGEVIGRRIEVA